MASGKRKTATAIQIVLTLAVLAGVAWLVFKVVGYYQAQQVYDKLEAAYAGELSVGVDAWEESSSDSPIDFAALTGQCPNAVAWLAMEDVDVSYPVVQGDDNEHYLHYDANDNPSVDGSIFLDSRNKSLDADLYALVYGHNMRDESMFGQLDEYTSQDFYQRGTGSFRIYTPDGSYRYKIFAVNIVDPTDETYTAGFTDTQTFGAFVKQLKENSMYDTGVSVAGYDHVVTLSTCSDSDRLVLCAKRVQ